MRWTRALPIWTIAFAIIYVPTMYFNLPVFTYVPQMHAWHWLFYGPPKAEGPGMFYYGWVVTSAIGAAIAAFLATLLPDATTRRIWSGFTWLMPLCAVCVLIYILRPWFLQ
ncbi:MAG TPA: hypothetical protein VL993_07200 [Stellaceae bacterium]|nr:hypothetical protein [Stellaceae bacterium]